MDGKEWMESWELLQEMYRIFKERNPEVDVWMPYTRIQNALLAKKPRTEEADHEAP